MKTNQEHFKSLKFKKGERGNALIYVLVAIALFAALSFTLSRQTDTSEQGALSEDQAELYASQLISYAVQAKSAVDQMMFMGADIDELNFTLPNAAGFNAGSHIYKVYHPQGGGLNPGRIPAPITTSNISDPPAGWYMGRFNTIEWTATTNQDVILTAYQINKTVCEKLNEKITGTKVIPTMGDSIRETMIDATYFAGSNTDLTTDPAGTPICAGCHKAASLCVENQTQNAYAFYTVIADW